MDTIDLYSIEEKPAVVLASLVRDDDGTTSAIADVAELRKAIAKALGAPFRGIGQGAKRPAATGEIDLEPGTERHFRAVAYDISERFGLVLRDRGAPPPPGGPPPGDELGTGKLGVDEEISS